MGEPDKENQKPVEQKTETAKLESDFLKQARRRATKSALKKHAFSSAFLMLGIAMLLTAGASLYVALNLVTVARDLKINGYVQAIEKTTPLAHNNGGVIKEIFVTEGEVVQEGQIVASLKTTDIDEELLSTRKTVASLLLRANCLRAQRELAQPYLVSDRLRQTIGRLEQGKEMRQFNRKCDAEIKQLVMKREFSQTQLAHLKDLERLNGRIVEIDTAIYSELTENEKKEGASLSQLRDQRTRFENELLSRQVRAAYDSAKAKLASQEQERIRNIETELDLISNALIEAEADLTAIERILADKFIYASASGRVQRMRVKKPGIRIAAGAHFLEISPIQTDFEVVSRISMLDMPNIRSGMAVHVKLSSDRKSDIWVPAIIDQVVKTSNNERLVSVKLKREDLNKRDLLFGDNSLNGLGERADALISIRSETALESLGVTLGQMFRQRFQAAAFET